MQRRTPTSPLDSRTFTDADLRRVQRGLRWLTMASVLAFVVLSVEGAGWWAARASWAFAVMLALDLLIAVPVELLRIHRQWSTRRQSRQAMGDAYDEIIAARHRK